MCVCVFVLCTVYNRNGILSKKYRCATSQYNRKQHTTLRTFHPHAARERLQSRLRESASSDAFVYDIFVICNNCICGKLKVLIKYLQCNENLVNSKQRNKRNNTYTLEILCESVCLCVCAQALDTYNKTTCIYCSCCRKCDGSAAAAATAAGAVAIQRVNKTGSPTFCGKRVRINPAPTFHTPPPSLSPPFVHQFLQRFRFVCVFVLRNF